MAIEAKRGCGYRKVGGLYLVGSGISIACDRLPYELTLCPCCGAGIKQARGFTWLDAKQFFGEHKSCTCNNFCPICHPEKYLELTQHKITKYGLLWVGEKYYTPASFIEEAKKIGVSKRIAQIPRELRLGETWVLLAHPKAITKPDPEKKKLFKDSPAIFYAFKPARIEKIITQKQATKTMLKKLAKREITPVIVPNDDKDHR